MNIRKFGDLYLDVEKIKYVYRFRPNISAPGLIPGGSKERGGVRISFGHGEITFHEDEPGFEEFIHWLEEHD